jgi:tRNA-specific 2-thiouridylase
MNRYISRKPKVYVAMSGGVDSSVAAALLKKLNFDVVGVFMKPWSPEGDYQSQIINLSANSKLKIINSENYCLWKQDREDAMRVASVIGIPFLTWDFSREYKKEVADYMIREYKFGRTPNPDIMCNKHIKFGLFLDKSLREGADYIATGHYVRILKEPKKPDMIENYRLKIAKDKNKDQSYFLWTLTQKQLKYCLFPIGDYLKSEVRKMAKKFNLPTAEKKDSQGVCFIGSLDMKNFLKFYIKPKKGKILDLQGNFVGYHDGIFYYTIGQRHGLNIGNGRGPYYVIKKDVKNNLIYVGSKIELQNTVFTVKVKDVNWISKIILPKKLKIRIRHQAPLSEALISKISDQKLRVVFNKPQMAITSGQSAVFYEKDELVGGGIIE